MSTIVSATTRSIGRGQGKRAKFIGRSSVLLREAMQHYRDANYADALECAYQAALRAAGAYITSSPVATRRRRPTGAWKQLALVDSTGKQWADVFSTYSRMRSRVMTGLDSEVSATVVKELLMQVEEFLDVVESADQGGSLAA